MNGWADGLEDRRRMDGEAGGVHGIQTDIGREERRIDGQAGLGLGTKIFLLFFIAFGNEYGFHSCIINIEQYLHSLKDVF